MALLCKVLIKFAEIINLVIILHRVAKKAEKPLDKILQGCYNTKAVREKRLAITAISRVEKTFLKKFKKGVDKSETM